MKVKTSVTLSEELLQAISVEVDQESRSAFIEQAAWNHLHARRRAIRDRKEPAAIDAKAKELNDDSSEPSVTGRTAGFRPSRSRNASYHWITLTATRSASGFWHIKEKSADSCPK